MGTFNIVQNIALLSLAAAMPAAAADGWLTWRGAAQDGVSLESGLPEIRLEAEADDEMAVALQARLREVLTLRIPVTAVAAGSLPAFEVKAKRWVVVG